MAEKFEAHGPLDMVRSISGQVESMGKQANYFMNGDMPEKYGFLQNVGALNEAHPLKGHEVYASGTYVHVEVNDETLDVTYTLPNDESKVPQITAKGVYKGFKVLPIHNVFDDKIFFSFVHKVVGEVTPESSDKERIAPDVYILPRNSEIMPVLPVNAHSLEDLKHDEVRTEIDKISSDMHVGHRLRVLREVSALFSKTVDLGVEDLDDLQLQRVSYLNSCGLLAGIEVRAREFIFSKDNSLDFRDEVFFSTYDEVVDFKPEYFTLSAGYAREISLQDVVPTSTLDLYLYCSRDSKGGFYVPVDSLIEAQSDKR